ncbi:MAG TPA: formimidoylglutamase [Chitinophagaceae bacterium]|nr:formimidoylglutamase [Chitinophagaceae bacterium]
MSDYLHIQDFLSPVHFGEPGSMEPFKDQQIGKVIDANDHYFPDLEEADIVLVGIGEERGGGHQRDHSEGPDRVRAQLYRLYHWHKDIRLADLGNIRQGATLQDTCAAAKTVLTELLRAEKTVVILGGSHDLTHVQYQSYAARQRLVEVTVVDSLIDLEDNPADKSRSFLMDMLTDQPNYIRHYNHIGFQSYYIHPRILETLDKLRFDCYRLGRVRENMDETEPVMRNSDMLSMDISALKYTDAPGCSDSPNGFTGDEACMLTRYAGMSSQLSSIGIYEYQPDKDRENLTAKQIAQMIWYFIDGKALRKKEAGITERESFLEYHVAFTELDTIFLKSKKTGRWWMQVQKDQFIPCSYKDYLTASSNEIPERWMRVHERI